ncbi:GNAT family N-acetyltransferase [Fusibacter sp. JL216-2]|uniref:GNAT family N-acetyltransferase n=1 Tax=Fusibacter sp. JL216-2 TaxID=3071453 RepID=UPI003D325D28
MTDLKCCVFHGKSGPLQKAWKVRECVFVYEQNVPKDIERDSYDQSAWHIVVFHKEDAVGTGRLFELEKGHYVIGRVAVLKDLRRKGLGQVIMKALLEKAWEEKALDVELHAQKDAVPFYENLGFVSEGHIFKEAGIDHITMKIKRPN